MKSFFTWRKTISGKLTLIYTTMFIIVLLILNGASLLGLRYFIMHNARGNLVSTMDLVITRIKTGLGTSEQEFMEELSQSEPKIYFRILSTNKVVLIQSRLLEGVDIPVKKGFNQFNKGDRTFLYSSSLILNEGNFVGYLQVIREITLEYHFLKVLFSILAITSLVGGVGALFVGYLITRRTLKPISMLTRTAQNISIYDLGQRLDIEGPDDELTDLARTFNSMLDRLQESFKKQEQFVSDASHELRTPISVINGYANLLDRWGKEDVKIRDEAIDAIKREADNMGSLVENLLFLARGDSDKIDIKKEEFWMDRLVDEVVKETAMFSKEVTVTCSTGSAIKFYGDRKLIKQMLRAFIDNSLKYSPSGGKITVDCRERDNWVELVVTDTGIGIPEDDLPYIFDRFYQVDKARSTEHSGTGLGLAIVHWIIEAHQGKVEVESTPGEGTAFTVFLPRKSKVTG